MTYLAKMEMPRVTRLDLRNDFVVENGLKTKILSDNYANVFRWIFCLQASPKDENNFSFGL